MKIKKIAVNISILLFLAFLPKLAEKEFFSFLNPTNLSFKNELFFPIAIYVLLALGLNIVVGKSGLLDIGYVAFFAIGGYSYAIFSTKLNLDPYLSLLLTIPVSILISLFFAFPALRTKGDYLALITLALGESVQKMINNIDILGGSDGISGIKPLNKILNFEFDIMHSENYYYLTVIIILLVIKYVKYLEEGRAGRAWSTIREDEEMGIIFGLKNISYKIYAFILSGLIGGIAGGIYASSALYLSPETFNYNISIIVLSSIILGGIGNVYGVIVGAVILSYLPDRIRFLQETRMILFGLILILIVNIKPDGLFKSRKKNNLQLKKEERDNRNLTTNLPNNKVSNSEIIKEKTNKVRDSIIEIRELSFGFNDNKIFNKLNLNINRNEITAIVGPNGAGKTTFFNILTKINTNYQGMILVNKRDLSLVKKSNLLDIGITRTFQSPRTLNKVSEIENIALGSDSKFYPSPLKSLLKIKKTTIKKQVKSLEESKNFIFKEEYEKRKNDLRLIELARAYESSAEIILIDEPVAGYGLEDREFVRDIIKELKAEGKTIILIDHDINFIKEISDRVIVFDSGMVIYDGDGRNIEKNEKVKKAYLGEYNA